MWLSNLFVVRKGASPQIVKTTYEEGRKYGDAHSTTRTPYNDRIPPHTYTRLLLFRAI